MANNGLLLSGQQLVYRAFRRIGIVHDFEELSADDLQVGLDALEELLDSWSIDPATFPALARHNFATVAGTARYTIGATGADWTYPRPTWVETVTWRQTGDGVTESELLPIAFEDWGGWDKSTTGTPTRYFYDKAIAEDRAVLVAAFYLYPVPVAGGEAGLYLPGAVPNIQARTVKIRWPDGYGSAIKSNLALKMAGEYGDKAGAPDQALVREAGMYLRNIRTANTRDRGSRSPEALFPASNAAGGLLGSGDGFNTI